MLIQNNLSKQNKEPIVGIDLGTTNSLVAIVRDGKPVILKSPDGARLTPSVISLIDGRPVVGSIAKKNQREDAPNTIFSVKRLLGRGLTDLQDILPSLPYEVDASGSGEGSLRVRLGDQSYTAVELSSWILKELKKNAEVALGQPVHQAVITVPAYFNDAQRQATRTAGRLAGWDVLRMINEPTAASLAYGLDRKKQGTIAVYDLGGGTFDVSILRLHDGIFEVLATHGDTTLGGDDLDRCLAQEVAREIRNRLGVELFSDSDQNKTLHAALLESCEKLKWELAEKPEARLVLKLDENQFFEKVYTREAYELLVRPLLERTREPCLKALHDAGLQPSDLTDVVLVGGPTRLAIVQKIAEEVFGRRPNHSVHPDEVVAEGAAIQADILAGNNRDLLLLDVVPLSLGIETYGGLMSTLIPRNTRIPTVAKETFTTFVDRQTGVDIHVLQGERERVEDNRSLARFKLKGIQPMPAGMPRIEVSFLIDADGILQVAATDLKTGQEQVVEVKPTFGLSDEEVESMLRASMENAEGDVAFRAWVSAKNEAEPVLKATENGLSQAGKLLPQAEAETITQAVEVLKKLLSDSDRQSFASNAEKIRSATQALNRCTVHLAELLLKGNSEGRNPNA